MMMVADIVPFLAVIKVVVRFVEFRFTGFDVTTLFGRTFILALLEVVFVFDF